MGWWFCIIEYWYWIILFDMVFRIRDKSLFWTKSGWKNNWEPKILNMPKPINSVNTQYLTCRFDHHSFLRSINSTIQSYRPIATSPVPANSTSTATLLPNNTSFLNSAISSNFPSIHKLPSSWSRTEEYYFVDLVKENGWPNRQRLRVDESQLPSCPVLYLRVD